MDNSKDPLFIYGMRYFFLNKYFESEQYLSKFIETNPNDSQAFAYRGAARSYLGNYSGSIEDCNKALVLNISNDYAFVCRAFAKNHLEDYKGAIEDCNKALSINPYNVNAYATRAAAKNWLKDYFGVIEDCNIAIELDPNNPIPYLDRGAAKDYIEDYQGAINDSTIAIKLDPNNPNPYINRAHSKTSLEDYIGAIEDCNMAIALNPKDDGYYISRGVPQAQLGFYDEAIESYDLAIVINPYNALAFSLRAVSMYNLGKYLDAIQDCDIAIQIGSTNKHLYTSCGEIYFMWKREIEKTICCFRIASNLDPQDGKILFQVANYYMEWKIKSLNNDIFLNLLGNYGEVCKDFYIDEIAYNERIQIAKGFYSEAFKFLMPIMRTDLNDDVNFYTLYLFIANNEHILSPVDDKSFYFSDARSFSDATDCPLLNPINKTKASVQTAYSNVRIRCLCNCDLEGPNGIEKCPSVWDRHANGHHGIAYKLKIEKDWIIHNELYLNKVEYSSSEVELISDSPEQVIQNGLYIKNYDYADEREWRIIKLGQFDGKKGYKIPWVFDGKIGVKIEAIYIGNKVEEKLRKEIYQKVKNEKIELFKMSINEKNVLKALKVNNN